MKCKYLSVAHLRGGRRGHGPPPGRPNSFDFMHFSVKIGKMLCWRTPPWGVGGPPLGNPGSAAVYCPPCGGGAKVYAAPHPYIRQWFLEKYTIMFCFPFLNFLWHHSRP